MEIDAGAGAGTDVQAGPGSAGGPAAAAGRPSVTVRRAGVADAEALVGLRAMMFRAMGVEIGPADAPWRAEAREWFAERLADRADFAAFVVDDPELGVVSNAVGGCDHHAPGPVNRAGLHGHISNVSTDPRRQRRGYAKACLEALLEWFGQETEARAINLNATSHGDALYRALGFGSPRHPALQIRLADGDGATGSR